MVINWGVAVDFDIFCADPKVALAYSGRGEGGRPVYDPVMIFKILIIQTQNNLPDDCTEFLINDRLSFMRFSGLGNRMLWAFRERLTSD
ncbi:MAG: transposase [Alphaproteobacteria bacterium]|nr:transposase [Alphaproteobacteria bacterium]